MKLVLGVHEQGVDLPTEQRVPRKRITRKLGERSSLLGNCCWECRINKSGFSAETRRLSAKAKPRNTMWCKRLKWNTQIRDWRFSKPNPQGEQGS